MYSIRSKFSIIVLFCGLTCEGRGGDPRGRLPVGLPRLLHAMRMLHQYNFATLRRRGRLGFQPVADPSPEGGYFVTSWISHWPKIETSTRTTSPASYTRSTRNEYRNISQHIAAVTIAVTRYRIKAQFFMFILLPVRDSLLYPFDIVDIIKIIFHRVAGFEGLCTYRRISGQTLTLSTPQRGRAPEYPTMIPPLLFAPAPTWRTAQG